MDLLANWIALIGVLGQLAVKRLKGISHAVGLEEVLLSPVHPQSPMHLPLKPSG